MKKIILSLSAATLIISCNMPEKHTRPVAKFDPLDTSTRPEYKDYNKAIKLDSNNAVTYVNRAHQKYVDTDWAGSLSDYNIANFINPKDAYALDGLGALYMHMKNYDSALSVLDRAIAINKTLNTAFYNRAITKSKLKQYEGALADMTQAIALGSTDAKSYGEKAYLDFVLDKYQETIDDATITISKDSMNDNAYLNRAGAKYSLGNYQGAFDDYTKCVSINPKNADGYTGLGLVRDKLKQ